MEATDIALGGIRRLDQELNCFITVLWEQARQEARALDDLRASGLILSPLHGLPVAVKDNTATRGIRTTAGSSVLENWVPDEDATVVRKLRQAGAVIIGKTNLFEFAAGGVSPIYGETKNPWNLARSAGASSSGSASAVAAGLACLATGSDTGGSIRLPASVCGVVGLKPTFGLVSRHGVIPGSYNLDHVGFLARDVWGVASPLEVAAGRDPADPTTINCEPVAYTARLDQGVRGLRIGLARGLELEPIDGDLVAALATAAAIFQEAGAHLVDVELPDLEMARTIMLAIHAVECAEYHHHTLRTHRYELSDGVRALLEQGELISASEYVRCQRLRQRLIEESAELNRTADLILLPTVPIASWQAGATSIEVGGKTEDLLTAITRYTPLFNLSGQPAISIPCGLDGDGLPLGIQIAGRPHEDELVLRAARVYERAVGRFPPPERLHSATASTGGTP